MVTTTIKFVLDKRRPLKGGKFPLKLRIGHNRTSAHLKTSFRLDEKDWDSKREKLKISSKSFDNVTRFNNQLQSKKSKYYSIISDLEDTDVLSQLNASQLKKSLEDQPQKPSTLYEFIEEQYEMKKMAGIEGTAQTYRDVRNKLKKFTDKNLSFTDITYSFLVKLEHQHIADGNKYSSLSVYLRTLRSLYNQAIKSGVAKKAHYPFSQYTIKNGEPSRRALTDANMKKLINSEFKKGSAEQIGKDYYLASFYLQGINWIDIAYLQYKNFSSDGSRINYIRRKNGKSFNIKVTDKLMEIINRLKPVNDCDPEDFIFPILDLDTERSFYHKRSGNRRLKINKYLHRIAAKLDIPKFSIYSARHTYATMLWNKSGSASITQQSLGHKTEEQTQEYLSFFGNDKVDNAAIDLFDEL